MTLPVYDSINHKRLLGYHPRWSDSHPCQRFASARLPSMASCRPTLELPEVSFNVNYVEFRRDYLYSDGGWKVEPILLTYSPLEHLMMLQDFKLPGETDEQAYRRRHWY